MASSPSLKCDASKYHITTVEEAKLLFGQRRLYVWGAGQKGRGFCDRLKQLGFSAEALLDSDAQLIGTTYRDIPIIHPNSLLDDSGRTADSFVLTASVDSKYRQMFAIADSKGWTRGVNYQSIQTLSPFYPTIEIAGLCNIKCSSCPRGDFEGLMEVGKFMSLDDYRRVITKLSTEIPFLYLVDLYVFGEPILNPELPDIIRVNNELGIASGLSTNLNSIRNLERTLEAFPAQLRVSLSGASSDTYDVTHTGGKWTRVEKNIVALGEMQEKFSHRTIVEVYFHAYRHNLHEVEAVKELCDRYKFRFHPSLGVVFPDYAMSYLETGTLAPSARPAAELMILSLDQLIADCRSRSHGDCILTRIVPVINWDLSVMPCCNYAYSRIAPNYLEISLADLIDSRTHSEQCLRCQSHSLHRWNDQGFYRELVSEQITSARVT